MQINQIDNELTRIKRQISAISASDEPYNAPLQAGDTKVSLPPVFGAKKLMSPIKSLNLQRVANELEHPEKEQNWIRLNELADNSKEKMGAGISAKSKSPKCISQVESANGATDNDEELSYYLLSNTTSNVRDPAETWSHEKVHELL